MTYPLHGDSTAFSRELAELKRQLQEQVALLRDERLEELIERMHATTQRLQTLPVGTELPEELMSELAEIRFLHRDLELSLADRMSDTRRRLTHLHKGRRVVRAYRG